MQRACVNCRHFSPSWDYAETGLGECRRYAPRPLGQVDAQKYGATEWKWPIVDREDWCGEFFEKGEKP